MSTRSEAGWSGWVNGVGGVALVLSGADSLHLDLDLPVLPGKAVSEGAREAAVDLSRRLYDVIVAWPADSETLRTERVDLVAGPLDALAREGFGLWAIFRVEYGGDFAWRVAELRLKPKNPGRLWARVTLH